MVDLIIKKTFSATYSSTLSETHNYNSHIYNTFKVPTNNEMVFNTCRILVVILKQTTIKAINIEYCPSTCNKCVAWVKRYTYRCHSDIWMLFNNLMESQPLCTLVNGPIIVHPNRSKSVNHNEAHTFVSHSPYNRAHAVSSLHHYLIINTTIDLILISIWHFDYATHCRRARPFCDICPRMCYEL